jgi:SNF2 family DNA or RNA helicase
MGMGVTLTAADLMGYVTNTYSLSDRKQSEDRNHRIGQKRTCEYVDFVCPNTIDRTITTALLAKADLSKAVTRKEWARMVHGKTDGENVG